MSDSSTPPEEETFLTEPLPEPTGPPEADEVCKGVPEEDGHSAEGQTAAQMEFEW